MLWEAGGAIQLNTTGTLPPTGILKPNLKANHDINTRVLTSRHACLEVRFGFKEKIGSLSQGSVPVIFISMAGADYFGGTDRKGKITAAGPFSHWS
jgi:hypothetical protein